MRPNNQLLERKNSTRNVNTFDTENTGRKHALPERSHIVLSQIGT